MRTVLDTNVLISALIARGTPFKLLDVLLKGRHTIIVSRPIIEEFSAVAAEERIRRYVTAEDAASFLRTLVIRGIVVREKSRFRILKGPDDLILRTACDGKADLIVTGDKHLLELGYFRGIRIATVSEALQMVAKVTSHA